MMSGKDDKKGSPFGYIATLDACDTNGNDERQVWKWVKGQLVNSRYPKVCLAYTPKKNEKHSLEGLYTWTCNDKATNQKFQKGKGATNLNPTEESGNCMEYMAEEMRFTMKNKCDAKNKN